MRKNIVFAVFIPGLYAAVIFLGLEVLSRLYWYGYPKIVSQYNAHVDLRRIREAYHPRLWRTAWETYEPGRSVNLVDEGIRYEATINNIGLRDSDVEFRASNQPYVILCLGGSTTVEGDTNTTTYPYLLERMLRDRYKRDVRVLNGGVAGLKSREYPAMLARLSAFVEPDMVVEYNGVNDIVWNMMALWKQQRGFIANVVLRSCFIRLLFGDVFAPKREDIHHDIMVRMIQNLLTLAEELKPRGITLVVCSFVYLKPDELSFKESLYFDYNVRYWWGSSYLSYAKYCQIVARYNQTLAEVFDQSEVLYLAVAEQGGYSREDFHDICHMPSSGIAKKAASVADLLYQYIPRAQL